MAVLHVTKENFETEVLQSEKPVLVDFWASWCGPCKMVAPVLEEIAGEVTNVKIAKINVDEQPELSQKFQVMSIPTLILFKEGKVVNTTVGAQPKEDLVRFINS